MSLHIDNNSLAFLFCSDMSVGAQQEGEACPAVADAEGYACVVKKGIPITIIAAGGSEVTVNVTVPGGTIGFQVTVGATPETGYTFTTYSNETYVATK